MSFFGSIGNWINRKAEEAKREAERLAKEAKERAEEAKERAERLAEEAKEKAEAAEREAEAEARKLKAEAAEKAREAKEEAERLAEEAKEKAEQLAEEAKKKAEQLAEEAKEKAEELVKAIDGEYIKIKDDIRGLAAEAANSMVSRLYLPDLPKLLSSHLYLHQLANDPLRSDLEAKEYWGDSFSLRLNAPIGVNPFDAPLLTITPKFRVIDSSFDNSIHFDSSGKFTWGSLGFKGSQDVKDELSADVTIAAGVDVEIETFGAKGSFNIPVSVGPTLAKAQYSEGLVSVSAGVMVNGALEVDEQALNKKFNFSVMQPFTLDPQLDLNIGLSEDFSAGSIAEMAKDVVEGKMSLSSMNRMIKEHESLSAHAKLTDGRSFEGSLRLDPTQIAAPGDFRGLGASLYITPEVTLSFGAILQEEGQGVDLASIDSKISLKNQLSFVDGVGAKYDLDGSISQTASVFKTHIGDVTLTPFELPLWDAKLELLDVNLLNGDVTGPKEPTLTLI